MSRILMYCDDFSNIKIYSILKIGFIFLVVDRQLGKCILNAKKGYVRGNISC